MVGPVSRYRVVGILSICTTLNSRTHCPFPSHTVHTILRNAPKHSHDVWLLENLCGASADYVPNFAKFSRKNRKSLSCVWIRRELLTWVISQTRQDQKLSNNVYSSKTVYIVWAKLYFRIIPVQISYSSIYWQHSLLPYFTITLADYEKRKLATWSAANTPIGDLSCFSLPSSIAVYVALNPMSSFISVDWR